MEAGKHRGTGADKIPGTIQQKKIPMKKIQPAILKVQVRMPEAVENLDPDAGKSEQQVIDELTGQTNLFSEKDFEEDQKDKDWLSKQ